MNKIYCDTKEPIELKKAEYMGFTYKIVTIGRHPCAYVKIPRTNQLYNVQYSKIYINVHGCLTYSRFDDYGQYWIGWDYGQLDDYEYYPKGSIVPNYIMNDGKRWTIPLIEKECKQAIEQIRQLKKFRVNEYYYAIEELIK